MGKKMNLDPSYLLYTKVNFKLIVDLNIKVKIIKFLEENIRISLWLGVRQSFVKLITESNKHKFNFIKIKNCSSQAIIKIMNKQAADYKKMFTNHISNKGLAFRISKEFHNIWKRQTTNLKWAKDLSKYFMREDI